MIVRLRTLVVPVLVALLAPGVARAAIPVAVYPPRGTGVSEDTIADVQSLIESALRARVRRGVLVPATPLVLRASCSEPAQDACLGRLAGKGLVLHARVRSSGNVLVVTLALVDAEGKSTRPAAFGVDQAIMSSLSAQQALATLEALVEESAASGSVVSSAPRPKRAEGGQPHPSARADDSPAPAIAAPAPKAATPDLRAAPSAAPRPEYAMREPEAPRTPWQARAGKWSALGGLVLLAAGGAVGYLDKRLSDDLTASSQKNALTAADRSRYDRVKTYNLAANVLFAAGGAAVGTGLVLWAMAPAGDAGRWSPPHLGVQGGF